MALLSVPQGLGQIISLIQQGGVPLMSPLVDFVAPATSISYAPADPAAWNPWNPVPVPSTVQQALDTLISLMNVKISDVLGTVLGPGAGTINFNSHLRWCLMVGTAPGGGGGGALTNGGSGIVAAGGGASAGGTFWALAPAGLLGASQSYAVGSAGAGGAAGANGNPGSGPTSIGALYSAAAGLAGNGHNSTTAVSNTAAVSGGAATVGAFGLFGLNGGGGEAGTAEGNTTAVACWGTSGRGGMSFWGPGGVARRQNQQSLTTDFDQAGSNAPAANAGAAGGGALCFTSNTGAAGGNGADGRIMYWEFVS